MLAGKPGDRKSSVIRSAERLARALPSRPAFLPANFSPESMFDEYASNPDRIWIEDDANQTILDWQKTTNGERNAARILKLYDCAPLSESFKRNQEHGGDQRRDVDETSTSLLFGCTFQACRFADVATRSGMARRFLYYVADAPGRFISMPSADDDGTRIATLAAQLDRLVTLTGPMNFDADGRIAWEHYQRENRAFSEALDSANEAELSRLSSIPMQTLKVAMIFEACRWAQRGGEWNGLIGADTLGCAVLHTNC